MNDYELSEQHMRAVYTHREPLSLSEIRGEHWDLFIAKVKADALREAAGAYRSGQLTGVFMGRDDYPREWLRNRADKIERGES